MGIHHIDAIIVVAGAVAIQDGVVPGFCQVDAIAVPLTGVTKNCVLLGFLQIDAIAVPRAVVVENLVVIGFYSYAGIARSGCS